MHILKVIEVDTHADMHIYSALLLGVLQPKVPQRGVSPSQRGPCTQMGWFGELHGPPSTRESRACQNERSLSPCQTTSPTSPPQHSNVSPAHQSSSLSVSMRLKT